MNLEARPWLGDFHAVATLDSFPFFCFFLLGLFFVLSKFQGQGLGRFLSDWAGQFGSCVSFRPADPPVQYWARGGSFCLFVCLLFFPFCRPPPTQCWAMIWVIRPLN